MQLTPLTALSPLDGRYNEQTSELRPLFSEFGLMKYRLCVEVQWLKFLANEPKIPEIKKFKPMEEKFLDNIWQDFTEKDALQIKKQEKTCQHDVKAIEYFLREKISQQVKLRGVTTFIHFAATSEDINNLAYSLILKTFRNQQLLPELRNLIDKLQVLTEQYAGSAMLAHTHGQPASTTTFGKEIANFIKRLQQQIKVLLHIPISGKFNGAVGNFNTHCAAYPNINWENFARLFVTNLGLTFNEYTTQIEPHDRLAEFCDALARINTILLDLARDIWGYISLGYLQQKSKACEIGSSVMPHKINPIDFENAEGNLGLANALLRHFSEKLPISRWQRDLSDSTALRNLGVAFGHSLLAYKSLTKGLAKIKVNNEHLNKELNEHWEILAEAIQTMLRRYGVEDAYEKLKALTRGKKITKEILHDFIRTTKLPAQAKKQLLTLTPQNYLGLAIALAKNISSDS